MVTANKDIVSYRLICHRSSEFGRTDEKDEWVNLSHGLSLATDFTKSKDIKLADPWKCKYNYKKKEEIRSRALKNFLTLFYIMRLVMLDKF
jgi:hypothetical protein